ncbi:hypothetical protein HK097_000022 [Rhizophlyctis rosea]|uniref:DUF4211 domain-containing protein n=1 Tax=Rhizophlyctis rosea TaxID=64517 RepID=A0AAD5X9L1_9FUNG|nr:hypothetical protein HK097_000022 [Rhizophlyctis rosea]
MKQMQEEERQTPSTKPQNQPISLDSDDQSYEEDHQLPTPKKHPLIYGKLPVSSSGSEEEDEDDPPIVYKRHKPTAYDGTSEDDSGTKRKRLTPKGKRVLAGRVELVERGGTSGRSKPPDDDGDGEESEVPVQAHGHKSKRRRVEESQSEEDDLELDYDEVLEEKARKRHNKPSEKASALEQLRARKQGQTNLDSSPPRQSASSENDLESDEESEVNSYTGNLDDELDEDLDDFVVGADEEDGESGEPIVLPAIFRMSSNKPEEAHRAFLEFLVRVAITPKFGKQVYKKKNQGQYEHYLMAISRIDDRTAGYKRGLISSEAWTQRFREAVELYPRYDTFHVAAGICTCEACYPRQRPATRRVVLGGVPYDRNTLLPTDEDEGETFMLGRFCAARSELYHRLHHYKQHTLGRVQTEIGHYRNREPDGGGGYGPEATEKGLFQRFVEDGFVEMMFQSFEMLIEEAENFGTGDSGRWGQTSVADYFD